MNHNVSLNAARSALESCAVLLISMQNASPQLLNGIGCLQEVMASRETWKFMVMALICVNLKQLLGMWMPPCQSTSSGRMGAMCLWALSTASTQARHALLAEHMQDALAQVN